VIAAALIIFGQFLSAFHSSTRIHPVEDQSRFNVRLKTPVGSALSYSD